MKENHLKIRQEKRNVMAKLNWNGTNESRVHEENVMMGEVIVLPTIEFNLVWFESGQMSLKKYEHRPREGS